MKKNNHQIFDGTVEKIVKKLMFFFLIFLSCFIPIIFAINLDSIGKLLCIDKNKTMDIFLAILPLVLTIILVLINTLNEYSKEQKELKRNAKEKIDTIVEKYNGIIIKLVANYNTLMNDMYQMIGFLNGLKNNQYLFVIIDLWEKETKNIIEFSNDSSFRSIIRGNINELIGIFKQNNNFDHNLEYINSLSITFGKQDNITNEDRIFIHNLRNYISFSKKEKNIISVYLDLFNNGKLTYLARDELIIVSKAIKERYENEIRLKEINDKKFHDILCSFFYKLFRYCELLSHEIYYINSFQELLIKNFNGFYEQNNILFNKTLNEKLNSEDVQEGFIHNYINEKVINDFYRI